MHKTKPKKIPPNLQPCFYRYLPPSQFLYNTQEIISGRLKAKSTFLQTGFRFFPPLPSKKIDVFSSSLLSSPWPVTAFRSCSFLSFLCFHLQSADIHLKKRTLKKSLPQHLKYFLSQQFTWKHCCLWMIGMLPITLCIFPAARNLFNRMFNWPLA